MKRRLLIVDDDIITLKLLTKCLENEYEVESESSGYKVIANLSNYNVDLILLDLEMPVTDGINVLENIRSNANTRDVLVAMLVGLRSPSLVGELLKKGANDVIEKSMPNDEILIKVNQILSGKTADTDAQVILVIEQDTDEYKVIKDTLESVGFRVVGVTSALDAIKYIQNHNPALVLIGKDMYGYMPQEIYDEMNAIFRDENVRSIVMNGRLFSSELIERVDAVLGQ